MAGLIYTANVGGYDTPKAVEREPGIEYYQFTDGDEWPGWTKIELPPQMAKESPTFRARHVKVMTPDRCHGFDWYLWLDGTMRIKKPIAPLIEKLLAGQHDFAAFPHNEWDCAYQEVESCIQRRKDDPQKLQLARSRMLEAGFPKGFGQVATGVLWRRATDLVRSHALAWWIDMQQTTLRDQCTFMLNLWNLGSYYTEIPGLHVHNAWFEYRRGHVG